MNLLLGIITASIAGSVIFAALAALHPLTSRVFSKTWHYYSLLIPLVFLLGGTQLAIGLLGLIPQPMPAPAPAVSVATPLLAPAQREIPPPAPSTTGFSAFATFTNEIPRPPVPLLLAVWTLGAAAFMAIHTRKYLLYRRMLLHNAWRVTAHGCELPIWVSPAAHTPMLMGTIRPIIVLPNMAFSPAEMRMVLTHEMAHYKRGDMFVKLLMLAANALHWFNPAVYLLNRQLNAACELACDEQVVAQMDTPARVAYGQTILHVLKHSTSSANIAFATGLANSKKTFKRRLISMMNTRKMSKSVIALALACGLMIIGGGFLIAHMLGNAMPVAYAAEERRAEGNPGDITFSAEDIYTFYVITQGERSFTMADVYFGDAPAPHHISFAEAANLAADVIYATYGICVDGLAGHMTFVNITSSGETFWSGFIRYPERTTHSDGHELFHFQVTAESGEVRGLIKNTPENPFRG
jgi:beta-lactamase regulating signal transducer with metallopeptidase domain